MSMVVQMEGTITQFLPVLLYLFLQQLEVSRRHPVQWNHMPKSQKKESSTQPNEQ